MCFWKSLCNNMSAVCHIISRIVEHSEESPSIKSFTQMQKQQKRWLSQDLHLYYYINQMRLHYVTFNLICSIFWAWSVFYLLTNRICIMLCNLQQDRHFRNNACSVKNSNSFPQAIVKRFVMDPSTCIIMSLYNKDYDNSSSGWIYTNYNAQCKL